MSVGTIPLGVGQPSKARAQRDGSADECSSVRNCDDSPDRRSDIDVSRMPREAAKANDAELEPSCRWNLRPDRLDYLPSRADCFGSEYEIDEASRAGNQPRLSMTLQPMAKHMSSVSIFEWP